MALLEFEPSRFPGIFIEDGGGGFYGPAAAALYSLAHLKIGYDLLDIISKRTRGIGIGGAAPDLNKLKCIVRRAPGAGINEPGGQAGAFRPKNPDGPFVITGNLNYGGSYDSDKTARQFETRGMRALSIARVPTSAVALIEPTADYSAILGLPTPVFVALGHELIHCMHFLSGDTNNYPLFDEDDHEDEWEVADSYTKHEEARTVGLGIYAKTRISENAIRREAKLPERKYYDKPGDCDGMFSML